MSVYYLCKHGDVTGLNILVNSGSKIFYTHEAIDNASIGG